MTSTPPAGIAAADWLATPASVRELLVAQQQEIHGALCRSRLLTVTVTLHQQGRDVWLFLEQVWIAHHRGGVMPSPLPDR